MTAHLSRAHTELETKNTELATALQSLQESRQRLAALEQLKGELSKFVPTRSSDSSSRIECDRAGEAYRRVSVLFLDIAGYTRLSEQLEAKKAQPAPCRPTSRAFWKSSRTITAT